jgi:hypothetical protein
VVKCGFVYTVLMVCGRETAFWLKCMTCPGGTAVLEQLACQNPSGSTVLGMGAWCSSRFLQNSLCIHNLCLAALSLAEIDCKTAHPPCLVYCTIPTCGLLLLGTGRQPFRQHTSNALSRFASGLVALCSCYTCQPIGVGFGLFLVRVTS